ncbi:PilZ domain-containing protein [Desulfamplus magnetovallimortis]|nr:PilZ domain-containing protein [Desulfamplus magnetovallimortis]
MQKTEKNMIKERRQHERYRARDGAFAAISPNSFKLGQIINISRGGLAFQYIETQIEDFEKEESQIFLSSKGFYVRGLGFQQVSDRVIPSENPYSTLTMRQCAIKFENLTMDQMVNIDNYILHNTNQFTNN